MAGVRMDYLELTFPNAEDNLRCDEKLLGLCENGKSAGVLRFWEAPAPAVVAGRSNRDFAGVRLSECRSRGIPVLRRASGGGTVLVGPGSLNYALVARIDSNAELSTIPETNRYVMERNRTALERVVRRRVSVEGFTDLAVDGRKVSGNAQYRRRNAVLFHGTFLVAMDLDLIGRLLEIPPVAPEYRRGRSHPDFLMNLGVAATAVRDSMRAEWLAESTLDAQAVLGDMKSGRAGPPDLS